MKAETHHSLAWKTSSWSIIALVVAGTLIISGIADVSDQSGIMAKVFISFVAAIIVVQVIPGIMLVFAMGKAILSLFDKKAREKK